MSLSLVEALKALDEEAEAKKAALRQQYKTEIVKKLADAKAVVADLEKQYEAATGKTVTGAKVARVRLSPDEIKALEAKVDGIIKAAKDGISMGDIVQKAGASASAVRKAVKSLKGIKTTGNKATTLYHTK